MLDVVCNSILGRHGSVRALNPSNAYATYVFQENPGHRALALNATYDSSTILATIVDEMAKRSKLDVESAEHFLQKLRHWSRNLPAVLRRQYSTISDLEGTSNYREATIGNIHTAGSYYFGVILVTRQFLVRHTMPQLRRHGIRQTDSEDSSAYAKTAELSTACVEAANYLAKTCYVGLENEVLLDNMCILKYVLFGTRVRENYLLLTEIRAWVFTAGLVLGFALLGDNGSDSDVGVAFSNSVLFLKRTGQVSAQAEQYYRILTSFGETIEEYKRQRAREKQQSRSSLVDCIFPLSAADKELGEQTNAMQSQVPTPDFTISDLSEPMWQRYDFMSSRPGSQDGNNTWLPIADDELMLRMLWDNAASLIDPDLTTGLA